MKITIEDRERYSIVRPEGNIVRENQGELRAYVDDLLERKSLGIALDFGLVDYMDSAGLGCCVGIHKLMCEKRYGTLVLLRPSLNVGVLWRMIRLDLIIPMFDDEEEAVELLNQGPRPLAP